MASVAILRRGKAGYPHWEMTALVSSWGRACGSLPAFGGESEHTMFVSLNTGCAMLAAHFPTCHILAEGSRGQGRKRQLLRMRQGFPRAVIGSREL